MITFERWKAGIKPATFAANLAASLGRLRYAAR